MDATFNPPNALHGLPVDPFPFQDPPFAEAPHPAFTSLNTAFNSVEVDAAIVTGLSDIYGSSIREYLV